MIQIVLGLIIIFVFSVELILMNELGKKESKVRKVMNKIEFKLDSEKYVAYPLRRETLGWRRIEDIPKVNKAITVNLEESDSEYIITQDIFKEDEEYFKLYIIRNDDIQVTFVKKSAVCRLSPFKG